MSITDVIRLLLQKDTRDAVAEALAALKRTPAWKKDVVVLNETFKADERVQCDAFLRFALLAVSEKGWPENRVGVVSFVARELVENAFTHGLSGIRRGTVSLGLTVTPDHVVVECSDSGAGFSLADELAAQGYASLEPDGGSGLTQIHRACRRLEQSKATLRAEISRSIGRVARSIFRGFPHFVLECERFDQGEAATVKYRELREEIVACGSEATGGVILELKCSYISSAGLRWLMVTQKLSGKHNPIVIVHESPVLKEILEISRFNLVFTICESLETAVSALQRSEDPTG